MKHPLKIWILASVAIFLASFATSSLFLLIVPCKLTLSVCVGSSICLPLAAIGAIWARHVHAL